MIAQSRLNITGLSLDFVGVVLLACEWWLALSAKRLEAEIEDGQRRLAPHPLMPRPNNPHQAVFDHMRAQYAVCAEDGLPRPW